MKARPTKTLNPLPFGDLEPHRFEDLIRQLVYDFRVWKSLEAIGRSGADEGIDVRATEVVVSRDVSPEDHDGEDAGEVASEDRIWIIQCKRQKAIGPAELREIIEESLPKDRESPHGFILAAACDFSKKARDAFREEMVERRIEEFYLWGKGELEDMLFQPKNDHLLFAYFGISIQVSRRSIKSELNARLSMKRRLLDVTDGLSGDRLRPPWMFLIDPHEERYPKSDSIPDFDSFPRWGFFQCLGHTPPFHLCFVVHRFFGYYNIENGTWDMLEGFDQQKDASPAMKSHRRKDKEWQEQERCFREEWHRATEKCEDQRCNVAFVRFIHYDRILAVDKDGDRANVGPHLYVEFDSVHGPFDEREVALAECEGGFDPRTRLDTNKRIEFFGSVSVPDTPPIPDDT